MSLARKYLLLIPFLLTACTLSVGGPSKLPDAPAPTTIPLAVTAAPAELGLPATPRPIALPPGFAISAFAEGLDEPRMLELGPDGQVYAVERGAGRVLRLPDRDGDGRLDQVEVVADGLDAPQTLAFYQDGSLYVAETKRVLKLGPADAQGAFGQPQVIIPDLPSGGHQSRTVLFSPDFQTLYVSVGSSCNVCQEQDQRRAAILRFNPDGSRGEIYARGLRNAVGLDIRPGTDELWATNNGRDFLGDDLPPETVYQVQAGGDYGWPRCHSGRVVDPEFGGQEGCQGVLPPAVEIPAHSAPLGLEFYRGDRFPAEYRDDLFVALHGSWNRSTPIGYKVVRIPFENGTPGPAEDFAAGWLPPGQGSWGRPVDVLTGSDGSLFVSDDAGGRIYRIVYIGEP